MLMSFQFTQEGQRNWCRTFKQLAIWPGDSTINQLVSMYHIFAEALDNKKDARLIFCEVTAAFERVWHTRLVSLL